MFDEFICEFELDKVILEFLVEVVGKFIYVVKEDEDLEIGVFVVKIDISVSVEGGESVVFVVFVVEEKKVEIFVLLSSNEFVFEKSIYVSGYFSFVVNKILVEKNINFVDV